MVYSGVVMNSLVIDFESKINCKEYSISDLLRHCLIIATKLKQREFVNWINNELNGYNEIKEVPRYRKIPVSVKFLNPIHGWCPYIITDKTINDELSKLPIRNSISEIEALANIENGTIRLGVPTQIKNVFLSSMDFESDISYEANKISMIGIVDSVKNEMLNWILKLEENDIIDDKYIFNKEQIDKATSVTTQIINNFFGDKDKIELNQNVGSE